MIQKSTVKKHKMYSVMLLAKCVALEGSASQLLHCYIFCIISGVQLQTLVCY